MKHNAFVGFCLSVAMILSFMAWGHFQRAKSSRVRVSSRPVVAVENTLRNSMIPAGAQWETLPRHSDDLRKPVKKTREASL